MTDCGQARFCMDPMQVTVVVVFVGVMMMSGLGMAFTGPRPPSGPYLLPMPSSTMVVEPWEGINVTTPLQGPRNIVEPSTVGYRLVLFNNENYPDATRPGQSPWHSQFLLQRNLTTISLCTLLSLTAQELHITPKSEYDFTPSMT